MYYKLAKYGENKGYRPLKTVCRFMKNRQWFLKFTVEKLKTSAFAGKKKN